MFLGLHECVLWNCGLVIVIVGGVGGSSQQEGRWGTMSATFYAMMTFHSQKRCFEPPSIDAPLGPDICSPGAGLPPDVFDRLGVPCGDEQQGEEGERAEAATASDGGLWPYG